MRYLKLLAKGLLSRLAGHPAPEATAPAAPAGQPPISKSVRTRALTFHETATGNYWLPTDAHQDIVAHAIRKNRVFEHEVVELASQHIRKGTAVLDVGANFGQMSILFSQLAGDDGRVYSFEADDFVFEILGKNIAANNRTGRIIPTFGAVHNVAGETLLFPEQDFKEFGTYGSYGIDYNASEGRKVPSVTIDSLDIREPVSFMKIDIQGGDLQGMQGALKTIRKNRMPILFEYEYQFELRYGMCFQDYVDFVRSIDYVFKRVVSGHNFLVVPR
jgi:FkbM family methyltransferase